MTGTHRTTIDGDPVAVRYEFFRFRKGKTDGKYGPAIEPDEPAHIQIYSVTGPAGVIAESEVDEPRIIDEIAESLHEQARGYE